MTSGHWLQPFLIQSHNPAKLISLFLAYFLLLPGLFLLHCLGHKHVRKEAPLFLVLVTEVADNLKQPPKTWEKDKLCTHCEAGDSVFPGFPAGPAVLSGCGLSVGPVLAQSAMTQQRQHPEQRQQTDLWSKGGLLGRVMVLLAWLLEECL